jgi:hypothetical protein
MPGCLRWRQLHSLVPERPQPLRHGHHLVALIPLGHGVAVDAKGYVYISGSNRIEKFSQP